MKKFALTIALLVANVFAFAAVTTPVSGVVRCTATADTVTNAHLPYGAKITSVKVVPVTANKAYRLRVGTVSGAILYETYSAGTTATLSAEPVKFTMPGAGIYYQTDDTSTNANITLYTE